MHTYTSLNFFSAVVLLPTFLGGILTNAYPQIEGDVSNIDLGKDKPTVYINNRPVPMPYLDDFESATYTMAQPEDVISARIENAPPGFGCFFDSHQDRRLVSPTFYSESTASYDSPLFSPIGFETTYARAKLMICFRLPNPSTSNNTTLILWDLLDNGQRKTFLQSVPIKRVLLVRMSWYKFGSGIDVLNAVVIHGRTKNTSCILTSRSGKDESFALRSTISDRLNDADRVSCMG